MNLAYGLQSGFHRSVYVICLPLNTTCSAIMKSFFECRKTSFVSISCRAKKASKMPKKTETREEKKLFKMVVKSWKSTKGCVFY